LGRKKKEEELVEELKTLLKQTNNSLDSHEKLSKIIVINEEWQVENNLLTPSLKIKRNEIERKYSPFYQEWSDQDGFVHFVE
jgi:long-chain acyl-CoA synthetase